MSWKGTVSPFFFVRVLHLINVTEKTENLLSDVIQMRREFLYRGLNIYLLLCVAPGPYAQPSDCVVGPEARVKCHKRFNDLAKYIRPRKHRICEVLIAVR